MCLVPQLWSEREKVLPGAHACQSTHHTVPHNCEQNYPAPGNATAKTSIRMTVLEESAGEQETRPLFSRQRRDCLQGSLSSHSVCVICLRGKRCPWPLHSLGISLDCLCEGELLFFCFLNTGSLFLDQTVLEFRDLLASASQVLLKHV